MAKSNAWSRLLSVLLLVAMLAGLLPATAQSLVTTVAAAEGDVPAWDTNEDGILSILTIGNSFSDDAMQYVYDIASNCGAESIQLGNLYIGGCTLATHKANAAGDLAKYTYRQNTAGSWSNIANYKMSQALTQRSWDYVSLQQASPNSGQQSTYTNGDLTYLIDYVKSKISAKNANAKLIWHMTWAYQGNSTHSGFANYGKSQSKMYTDIVNATKNVIAANPNFSIIVPNGTAIQNARTSFIKDNLCRDGYHLNTNIGRYIAGLTFVHALGLDVTNVTFRPSNVPDGFKAVAIESAINAVQTPFTTTTSAHADITNSSYYTLRTLSWTYNAYWHSTSADYYKKLHVATSSESTYQKYYATQRFTTYTLPIGSVITLQSGSGWRYRPDAWLTNTQQTSRPGLTTAAHTVCTDEWWKNADGKAYLYRAFNLSKTDGSKLASGLQSTLNTVFKIYIPKEYVTRDLDATTLYNNIGSLGAATPNNSKVSWSAPSKIPTYFSKDTWDNTYFFVYDPGDVGGDAWVMDPSTPRLWGTIHAAKVKVSGNRVYGADTNWGMNMGVRGDAYQNSGNIYRGPFRIKFKASYQTLTGTYDGEYFAYRSGRWQFYNSGAFDDAAYGAGIRPDIFFNVSDTKERFHFYIQSQYTSGETSRRSIFVDPATEEPYFTMSENEIKDTGTYACFHVYKIDTTKCNTEKLRDLLTEARNYLLTDHTYFPGEFETFIDAVNNAYATFNNSNGGASSKQSDVNAKATALRNAIDGLNYKNKINSLQIPFIKIKSSGDNSANLRDGKLNGTYFICRIYGGNIGSVQSFIDKKLSGSIFGLQRLRIDTGASPQVRPSNLDYATTLRFVSGSGNGYTMQTENGNYLTADTTKFTAIGDPDTFNFTDSLYSSYAGNISIYNSENTHVVTCDAADYYEWKLQPKGNAYNSTTYEKSNRASFRFYQLSPATLELYRALKFILPYCDQDKALDRYPADVYRQFLTDVKSAIDAYNNNNNSDKFSNASTKTTLDATAKKLRDWADKLTQADMSINYIDIPIEILDFKADGMLFEHDNRGTNYYGMVNNAAGVSQTMPGTTYYYNTSTGAVSTTSGSGYAFRKGLVEPNLVDGKPVYKQQTIAYVANAIMTDKGADNSPITNLKSCGADYNESFRDKMKTITDLGDWNRTLAKTSTGKNGGEIDWNEVETAYDLAYYALTYIWREVPATNENTLTDGDRYNMKVLERETLRLYKEKNSTLYTFFSDNNTAYNGTYLYNTLPAIANPSIGQYADFMPLNGLGFEKSKNTDSSIYFLNNGNHEKFATDNFHYAMHAYGSFVYYEDQDLYFDFVGDDDVYFFVNDYLVMDLGGSHSPVGGKVTLKDVVLADGSKLVDGEIYSFDMYYAERHTTGSNMKFNTNIKIVDTDTLTTKGQYIEISGDNNMVDDVTGMGGEMLDNGLVRVGDTVAYSFSVVNSHDVQIYDLVFEDETLGTYVSRYTANLTNEEWAFTPTDITDIEVYYRTSQKIGDAVTVDSSTPVKKTVDEIKAMINAANEACQETPGTSIPTGSYRVTMTNEQDLMDLMALGVPANCQIMLYGFKRLFVEEDENTTITNELEMSCSYLPWASGTVDMDVRTLTGTATRILKVAALSGVPSAKKAEYVIDFGKPLAMDVVDAVTDAKGVTNNGFVGFTKLGNYNGELLKATPADLTTVMKTESGRFEYRLGKIYYTMHDMLSTVENVYAVYALSGCEISDGSKARNYPYIVMQINVVPATTMYYETDFDQIGLVGSDKPYTLIDFGSNDKTVWKNVCPPNNAITGTKVDGVLRGTVSNRDPYILMDLDNSAPLNHVVTADDVVKVRIKSDACIGNGQQVFFMTNTNSGPVGGISTDNAEYSPNGQWQVVTLDIFDEVVGKTIYGLRLDPIGNNDSFVATGSYEYDWVYIGPDIPDEELFALTSEQSNVFTVNAGDYDAPMLQFNRDTAEISGATQMTANLNLKTGYLEGVIEGGDPHVSVSNQGNFDYVLKAGDIARIRFMVDDAACLCSACKCLSGKCTNCTCELCDCTNGRFAEAEYTAEETKLQLFFGLLSNGGATDPNYKTEPIAYTADGTYQTIEVKIPENCVGQTLQNLRIDLINTLNSDNPTRKVKYSIDWVYVGADPEIMTWPTVGTSDTTLQTATKVGEEDTYGRDASYDNGAIYSNNSTVFINGAGIPKFNRDYTPDFSANPTYTEVSFDFTGTGFDIISRTGAEQGGLRAMIYKENGDFVKAISVINTGTSELYQVPVISHRELDYGTYHVRLFVNAPYKNEALGTLTRGGEFFFDAIRIYNPVDISADTTEAKLANDMYLRHGEADQSVTETRDILIDADSFGVSGGMEGAAYIDEKIYAFNEIDLRMKDDDNYRLARKQETNLGDFVADALYYLFNKEPNVRIDGAFVVGKDIRKNLPVGKLYISTIQSTLPVGNSVCLQNVSGQQLLDALEWASRRVGKAENPAFMQVSGITYEIHTAVEPNVVEENGEWIGVQEITNDEGEEVARTDYRVQNVKIGGADLELEKTYLIAGYRNILVEMKEGFKMFEASTTAIDNVTDSASALLSYVESFPRRDADQLPGILANNSVLGANYEKMNGEGRISIVGDDESISEQESDADIGDKTPAIQDYKAIGPNQEVYLTQDTGITFKIVPNGDLPYRIDIGARSADGKPVILNVRVGATPPTELSAANGLAISSCTAQYYSLGINPTTWAENESGKYVYVMIGNTGRGVLSITDIKYAYNTVEPTASGTAEPAAYNTVRPMLRSRSGRGLSFFVDDAIFEAYGICVEHSYDYVDRGLEHEIVCTKCGYAETAMHTYENGACICGASKESSFDNNLAFNMSVTVGAEMSVGYSFMADAVKNYQRFYLEVSKAVAGGEPVVTVFEGEDFQTVTNPSTGEPIMYKVAYKGINAKEMGDAFTTTLYAVDDEGNVYCGSTQTSSIKSALLEKMSAENATAELKTMAIDMLNYGAAAQIRLNYNVENLVNADLTEEQKALGTQEVPAAEDKSDTDGDGIAINAAITVGSKVELGVSMLYTAPEGADVKCVITDEYGKVLATLDTEAKYNVMFSAKYGEVGAREMRKVINVAFFDGETQVSQTMSWSVESYVAQIRAKANVTEAEVNMVDAMLTYGDAVAAYLTATGQ